MDMNSKLTVIIPFYNSKNFINRCVKNLLDQTASNFQCILIDDGSSDKSYEQAVDAIAGNARFLLVRNETNMGIGYSRIKGIDLAGTEYLTFMDIDDRIEKDSIQNILDRIEKSEADLYVYEYYKEATTGETSLVSDTSYTIEELFSRNSKLISFVWNKVFKKDLFSNLDASFLENISFAEDLWICINSFIRAKKIELIHEAYYYYLYNPNSLVRKRTEKSIWDNISVLKSLQTLKTPIPFCIKEYICKESFHTYGLLIYPNPNNDFQSSPHFNEWRILDAENLIKLPQDVSFFLKVYIYIIRKKKDFIAFLMFKALYTAKKLGKR